MTGSPNSAGLPSRAPLESFVIDPWTYYDYKTTFDTPGGVGKSPVYSPPKWTGHHDRRLAAYRLLEAYCRNSSREYLPQELDWADKQEHREYGDPVTILEAITSSVLGQEQTIRVDGAFAASSEEDEEDAGGGLDELGVPTGRDPAVVQEEQLKKWAKQERFLLKLLENEKTATKLGDAVYVLGWNEDDARPRLRVWDPGFYFPVLEDWQNDTDWPLKVHIAWEYEEGDEKYLRRITWELRQTEKSYSHKWNAEHTKWSCFMKEMEWELDDIDGADPNDLSAEGAEMIMEETDLEIDFIPVIHLPNTVSENDHFGTSSIAHVMQIFDDLKSTDTDLQSASATTGSPPISVRGAMAKNEDGGVTSYGPGTVLESENGAELLDTSSSLDALLKYKDGLLDRLSVNSRTPNTLLGRIDPSKVPSGIVLTLSFQPHSNMVRNMRLVRADKYALLLKFVSRFYLKAGILEEIVDCHLEFGNYLPADRQETAGIVVNLLTAHAITLETAVALLVNAGYPIEDAAREIRMIREENFDAAIKALEATADMNWVRVDLLGLEPIPLDQLIPPPGQEPGGQQTQENEGETPPNPLLNPDQVPPAFG